MYVMHDSCPNHDSRITNSEHENNTMGLAEPQGKVHNEVAVVCANEQVRPRYFAMRLKAPRIAAHAQPGQFVSVLATEPAWGERIFEDEEDLWRRAGQAWSPQLLKRTMVRRPFSFSRIHRERGEFVILFRVIGKGTEAMSHMGPGKEVSLLGPLGNGFDLRAVNVKRPAILVGGGIGIAPFYALAQALRDRGVPAVAFFGGLDEANLPIALTDTVSAPGVKIRGVKECLKAVEYEAMGIHTAISTEKGRRGFKGYVSALLVGYLAEVGARAARRHEIFACGPWGMLKAIAKIARRYRVSCQVLLEGVMGCGIGVCMSCVCDVRLPGGAHGHKRICVDGPMFRAEEILWTGGPDGS